MWAVHSVWGLRAAPNGCLVASITSVVSSAARGESAVRAPAQSRAAPSEPSSLPHEIERVESRAAAGAWPRAASTASEATSARAMRPVGEGEGRETAAVPHQEAKGREGERAVCLTWRREGGGARDEQTARRGAVIVA